MTCELCFQGLVVKGHGWFSDMVIPGRDQLDGAPPDWPSALEPGSLNVKILEYPTEFRERGWDQITALDREAFEPAFAIPRDMIEGNQLRATPNDPKRGIAQIWRANMECVRGTLDCWVMRRFGSGYIDRIELLSDLHIREHFDLHISRTWPVTVRLFGCWKS